MNIFNINENVLFYGTTYKVIYSPTDNDKYYTVEPNDLIVGKHNVKFSKETFERNGTKEKK